jgi:hypothetical protein
VLDVLDNQPEATGSQAVGRACSWLIVAAGQRRCPPSVFSVTAVAIGQRSVLTSRALSVP